jgi:hypothetical protein
MQYRNPKNYELVREALERAGRTDLIGFEGRCLIRPRVTGQRGPAGKNQKTDVARAGKKNQKKKTIRNVHKKKRL